MITDIIRRSLSYTYGYLCSNFSLCETNIIAEEIKKFVDFDIKSFDSLYKHISYDEVQCYLSSVNEKGTKRKANGVYYTPSDVVKFIYTNAIKAYFNNLKPTNLHVQDLNGIPFYDIAYKNSVFDPTCGTGEFLINALSIKFDMIDLNQNIVTSTDINKVLKTIHGNDIDSDSTTISKIRLFIYILNRYGVEHISNVSKTLNACFSNVDFINLDESYNLKYDIIIGNPPYVEDSKCDTKPKIRYGNVYANVLENSLRCLKNNGVLGFIIPLSYVSTPRMTAIRNFLKSSLEDQYILSYSDRPDCLFTSVHQKLCILIGKNGSNKNLNIYTSNYQFWYKEERENLFLVVPSIKNDFINEEFIPKLGTTLDCNIYKKVTSISENTLYKELTGKNDSIYLNMRATFWIKSFRNEHKSGEYKNFKTNNKDIANFCMCLLNSSLFWWYWICTSDCWHITSKELKGFKIPKQIDYEIFNSFADKLEKKLERTKLYVGTKQTDYEYKHKSCIAEIREIDNAINSLFGLSEEESIYINNFALKYRVSGGYKA